MTKVRCVRRKDIQAESDKSIYRIQAIIRKDMMISITQRLKDKDMTCRELVELLMLMNMGNSSRERRIMNKEGMIIIHSIMQRCN